MCIYHLFKFNQFNKAHTANIVLPKWGADVHLMNILPLLNVSALFGLMSFKFPTSATLGSLAASF